MARMLHRREAPALGQKVFIAVAAYEGCGAGFTWSLFHTGAALAKAGIAYELAIYSGNCHVDDSRNRLVHDFLKSDCTDLFFLDADIGWNASDFVKLLGFDRDVSAAVYPKKHGDDTFPVKLIPGEIWADRDGLIEVQGVPTGFLRIRRCVLETLAAQSETYNAKNDGAYGTACIFERKIIDGSRWGGDYIFCRKAREAGFKIHVDPMIRFEHSGEHTWAGQLGAWLRSRAGIGLKAGLNAVREGRETAEDLLDLFDVWANPFAASPVLLKALAVLARGSNGPILECGSGLSTLVMAAANPNVTIDVLENSPTFAEHLRIEANRAGLSNIRIHCRPLKDGWYDLDFTAPWTLAVIDGPPVKDANRLVALDRLNLNDIVVVADDVQERGVPGLAERLGQTHAIEVVDCGVKSFAVGAPRKARQARAA